MPVARRLLPALPVAAAVAWLVTQAATGTPVVEGLQWIGFVVVGWLLPGAAVARACRREPGSLLEDLGWAAAASPAVGLAGWVAWQAIGLPPVVWGPAVTAVVLLVPEARRRVLARPAPGVGVGPSLLITGAVLVAIAWMASEYLRWVPADPGTGHVYYQDLLFQLALVGEASHSLPPTNPTVAGEPLTYHWFTHAIAAHASAAAGIEPALVTLRLLPTTLVLGITLLLSTVTRALSGHRWAGALAALLYAVVGELGGASWRATVPSIPMVHLHWWASLTQTMADLVTVGLAGLLALLLGRRAGGQPVALAIPLALVASGTKATVLPVLVCGALLAGGVALLRRDRAQLIVSVIVVAGLGAVIVASAAVLYGGDSYGTEVAPFVGAQFLASLLVPGLSDRVDGPVALAIVVPWLPTVTLTAFWLFVSLFRWVGVAWLAVRRPRSGATWFIIGCGVAGLAATLLLRHPGTSEIYFLRTAFPIGLIGSAWGLTLLGGDAPPASRRWHRWPWAVGGAATGALLSFVAARTWAGDESPLARWTALYGHPPTAAELSPVRQVLAYAAPVTVTVLALAGVGAVVAVALAGRRRRHGAPRWAGWFALLTVPALLGCGVASTAGWITGTSEPTIAESLASAPADSLAATSSAQVDAARWVRDHSAPTDVVATNRWCLDPQHDEAGQVQPCTATSFWVPAFTERRALVTGWAYAGRNLEEAASTGVRYNDTPFWDPDLLALQDRAFTSPSPAVLEALRGRGVRFLVLDKRVGPAAPELADLTRLRVDNADAAVYELDPAT